MEEGRIDLSRIVAGEYESPPTTDDIVALYVGGAEIPRVGAALFHTFEDEPFYIKEGMSTLGIKPFADGEEAELLYHVRPAMKVVVEGEICEDPVALPVEFLDLAAAKLRGEAYRLCDDDVQGERWLADYNFRLDHFRQWIKNRNRAFGSWR